VRPSLPPIIINNNNNNDGARPSIKSVKLEVFRNHCALFGGMHCFWDAREYPRQQLHCERVDCVRLAAPGSVSESLACNAPNAAVAPRGVSRVNTCPSVAACVRCRCVIRLWNARMHARSRSLAMRDVSGVRARETRLRDTSRSGECGALHGALDLCFETCPKLFLDIRTRGSKCINRSLGFMLGNKILSGFKESLLRIVAAAETR